MITFANPLNWLTYELAEDLQSRLLSQAPRGSTALLDAIYLGISKMRKAKYARKALLVILDGGDNHSRYHEREIKSMVRESDALYTPSAFMTALSPRWRSNSGLPSLVNSPKKVAVKCLASTILCI